MNIVEVFSALLGPGGDLVGRVQYMIVVLKMVASWRIA